MLLYIQDGICLKQYLQRIDKVKSLASTSLPNLNCGHRQNESKMKKMFRNDKFHIVWVTLR